MVTPLIKVDYFEMKVILYKNRRGVTMYKIKKIFFSMVAICRGFMSIINQGVGIICLQVVLKQHFIQLPEQRPFHKLH